MSRVEGFKSKIEGVNMDTASAFVKGEANRDNEQMVFDWEKAARMIKARNPRVASGGLHSDWEWTGGEIWKNNKPVSREDSEAYLSSSWAVPELNLDGEVFDCYKMQNKVPDWNSKTFWPKEALDIIGENK